MWHHRCVALVIVQTTDYASQPTRAYVACSPCMGTGSMQKGKGWLTCPACYGTGIRDMLYETAVHRGGH